MCVLCVCISSFSLMNIYLIVAGGMYVDLKLVRIRVFKDGANQDDGITCAPHSKAYEWLDHLVWGIKVVSCLGPQQVHIAYSQHVFLNFFGQGRILFSQPASRFLQLVFFSPNLHGNWKLEKQAVIFADGAGRQYEPTFFFLFYLFFSFN